MDAGDITLGPTLEHSKLEYADCPFCEQEFGTGQADDGQEVVAHTLPVCTKYVALAADEFLAEVLRAGRPS